MKVVYEEGDLVGLRRVQELDPSDWGMEQDEYDQLCQDQDDGIEFSIINEACDDYYNIIGENGHTYDAVSSYNFYPLSSTAVFELDLKG